MLLKFTKVTGKQNPVILALSQLCDLQVLRFNSDSRSWAGSELVTSVIYDRPHFFHNLPSSSRFLHRYQIILLGNIGTCVCVNNFSESLSRLGVERLQVWCPNHYCTKPDGRHKISIRLILKNQQNKCKPIRTSKSSTLHCWQILMIIITKFLLLCSKQIDLDTIKLTES